MTEAKETKDALMAEGRQILLAIDDISQRLKNARAGFAAATDDALIDSYIYEIIALNKKYEYFLKAAKEMGLSSASFRRSS